MPRHTQDKGNIPDRFLTQLKRDLIFRRIESGIRSLQANRHRFRCCRPGQENSAVSLGYLAAWVDVGFAAPRLVEQLLARFRKVSRGELALVDYLHLRLAEGYMAMSWGRLDEAIQHFETVLAFEPEIADKELMIIANFWIARCKRIQGRYGDALRYVEKAKRAALQMGYSNMEAVIEVLQAWCVFQEGRPSEARKMLEEAELVLQKTDDHVTRGNINSVYGRIARDEGNYDQALLRFANAIADYKKRDPKHRNLARTLVNVALVERLLALQLRDQINRDSAQRRGAQLSRTARETSSNRQHLERFYREAFKHLEEARAIYSYHNEHRGLGNIHIARSYLYLDKGELDRAASEGVSAYRIGTDKNDFILKARARIVQSAVAYCRSEEQIEEGGSYIKSSQLALELAREAVEYAKETQNRPLMAHSHIALGLAFCTDISADREEAQECCDEAMTLLKPKIDDYVWRELRMLKRILSSTGSVDSRLREWSEGLVRNKTFKQISEEFAVMVIPKVWAREGHKISRVVARLSISPKKVRKILRAQGLLSGSTY